MYEFVSGYAVPLVLLVSIFLGLLVYAYYAYEQSGDREEKNYTIKNFVDEMIEIPERKTVSPEYIETLETEMSMLEQKIAAIKSIGSKSEVDRLKNEMNIINKKIANIYNSPTA